MLQSDAFRFNVVDANVVSSFVGPAHALKILAAACSRGAEHVQAMLDLAVEYDPEWALRIKHGLHVFDEHNVTELSDYFQEVGVVDGALSQQPFRILDMETRRRSMVPARLGLIVFNLKERRIIQVQNNYADLMRSDRGRIRREGKPTRQVYTYALPDAWSIVP